jgi:pimeloyl-ACP methyl ester carboxylesterase
MEGMAEVIKAILAEEKIEHCTMMGHSMGGYISLAFAEKYPGLLSSFALVHSSAFADSEEKKANRLKSIEFVKKNGAYEFLKATIFSLYTESWASANRDTVEAQVEKSKAFSDEAIIRYYQAMIDRPDRTNVLRNFGKPILFIIGEHDLAVPFPQSLQQCYLPGQSHIHILRNSAHMGMLEEADKLNLALWQFK